MIVAQFHAYGMCVQFSKLAGHFFNGARLTNMSGNLPDKKSQLDLRSFQVGGPVVGSTVVP